MKVLRNKGEFCTQVYEKPFCTQESHGLSRREIQVDIIVDIIHARLSEKKEGRKIMNKLILPLLMKKGKGSKKKGTYKETYVVPTWNHLYVVVKNRPILDKWAIAHKNRLIFLCKEWMKENGWKTTENKKIAVNLWIFWNDARKKDAHNLDKLLLDAMEEAGIFDNDAHALVRYQDFEIDRENPRIEVSFEVVGEVRK